MKLFLACSGLIKGKKNIYITQTHPQVHKFVNNTLISFNLGVIKIHKFGFPPVVNMPKFTNTAMK
jgi:hypothetical protein